MNKNLVSLMFIVFTSLSQASPQINPVGGWKTDCVVFGRHSYISLLTFTEGHLVMINRFFETQNCSSQSITGTYKGNFSRQSINGDIQKITHHPVSARFTIHLPQVVKFWNDLNGPDGCELKNWVLDRSQEVLGRYCRPFDMPKAGADVSDFLSITGEELRFARSPAVVGELTQSSNLPTPIYRKIH